MEIERVLGFMDEFSSIIRESNLVDIRGRYSIPDDYELLALEPHVHAYDTMGKT